MVRYDAKVQEHHSLTIAGVRFALSEPFDSEAFPSSFSTFWKGNSTADLDCEVTCRGPDGISVTEPANPNQSWSFAVRGAHCNLVRRNRAGETLWRIAAPLTFERATVTWNPSCFAKLYGSYERAWGASLGLTLLVFRLRANGGLVLHGTAAEVDGRGIICTGVSGVGKSTIARLLDAAGATVLTDERSVVRQWPTPVSGAAVPSAGFRVHGSPWPSSANLACNASAPLRRIYFLEHGETERITPLSPRAAFARLIHVATIPWHDPLLFDPCLRTVETLLQSVPCAVLTFRPTAAAVNAIRKNME
jgi:hypothetical protein